MEDALPENETLAEHDKKKHPDGFDPKTDTCKFREKIATETETDNADEVSSDRDGQTNASKTTSQPKKGGISHIFTGSAANYDKPSLLKVGTGEGSQVYGWGLYGSTERGVAEGYTKAESARVFINGADETDNDEGDWKFYVVDAILNSKGDKNAAAEEIRSAIKRRRDLINTYKEHGIPVRIGDETEIEDLSEALRFISSPNSDMKVTGGGSIYEQTFFTDREPGDESHLLKWYEPTDIEVQKRLIEEAKKDGLIEEDELGFIVESASQRPIIKSSTLLRPFEGREIYSLIRQMLNGSSKRASEWLVAHDIDGVKYPVDSCGGKGVKNGDEVGWNYVSFRDDNIRIDKKYVDGQKMYDYEELMAKHHSNIDPMEVLSYLSKLDTPEEMAAEFARIMESGKIEKDKTVQDELVEALVMDAETLKDQTLQEHDRIHHKDGYHEGDTCKFRDKIKQETPEDKVDEVTSDRGGKEDGLSEGEREYLESVANEVKHFIPNVSVTISPKPYSPNGNPEERKALKRREINRWQKLLADFMNGGLAITDEKGKLIEDHTFDDHLVLEHTPMILQHFGVKDLPIKVNGHIINKILGKEPNDDGIYHETPWTSLARWQFDFDNPVAIFDHPKERGKIILFTRMIDLKSKEKTNDIIPLVLDAADKKGNPTNSHKVASAYGQKQCSIKEWVKNGYLLYVNKKLLDAKAKWLARHIPIDEDLKRQRVLTEADFPNLRLGQVDNDEQTDPNIRMFLDNEGVVVGTYNRKTNKVTVYPGANADTIAHELCGHATYQYAEQQAKKGDATLINKINEVVDDEMAKPVWAEVAANYDGENHDVQREEVWAHIVGHKGSKAIEDILKRKKGQKWYQKAWGVVKDTWRGLLSAAGLNKVNTKGIEKMSHEEFSDYMVKQMVERRTLGELENGEENGEGGERKSIRRKTLVTPEEDAAYMAAVEKGDMETAAKMVREVASRAFPNTKVLDSDGLPKIMFHGTEWDGNGAFLPGRVYFATEQGVEEFIDGAEEMNSLPLFVNITNPFYAQEGMTREDGSSYKGYGGREDVTGDDVTWGEDIQSDLERRGYDGIIDTFEGDAIGDDAFFNCVFNSRNIKSAAPVAYDNNGNVIPLSRRFDDGDDIRGDVSGKTEYIEKMKSLHPNINPDELIGKLKGLGSREEMEAEIKKILGKK